VKKLFTFLVLIFVVSSPAFAQAPKTLYCPEPNWDWGEVGIDFDLAHSYLLINGSTGTIMIDSVIAPCDCSLARPSDSSLGPGDTAKIILKFSTRDFYGRTTKQVDIYFRDSTKHYLQLTYSATVGQYYGGLKPEPISVFLLPNQPPRKVQIPIPANKFFSRAEIVGDIVAHSDIAQVRITKPKASTGESLELEVSPKPGLEKGTYTSNFRFQIRVDLKDQPQTLLITIPTKIVRY
jgi:hypothetical protein